MNSDFLKMKRLFLKQSYIDAWELYADSMEDENACLWDYIILTASNELQAEAFRKEIACRLEKKVIPDRIHYAVIPDPDGRRVGSGGAAFNVLKYLADIEGEGFADKRILVIHSGGDSKRIPQYSVCGKLFSPVPRQLPDGRMSTLFDELMIAMAGIPGRIESGMLTLSGDVMLLFNALQLDFQYNGAAAISIKESVETGKDHGVFLNDGNGYVKRFLHKQTAEALTSIGAVNAQGNVDLDTGAIMFDAALLRALWGLISTDGRLDDDKFAGFVNERSRVSFYGDFLYPLAGASTLEEFYTQAPEGEFNDELFECRRRIWDALNGFTMKLICLAPAEFIHFGTTHELWNLETKELGSYEHLGWTKRVCTDYQGALPLSIINGHIDDDIQAEGPAYIENCAIGKNVVIGENVILSGLTLNNVHIPSDCCMHKVKLLNGKYVVRVYGCMDNPKGRYMDKNGSTPFLGTDLRGFMRQMEITTDEVWDSGNSDGWYLWNAGLFPECDTLSEAVEWACTMRRVASGELCADEKLKGAYRSAKRYSLMDSFAEADAVDAITEKFALAELVKAYRFINMLKNRTPYEEALQVYRECTITQEEFSLLMECIKECSYSEKMRACLAISKYMKNKGIRYMYGGEELSAYAMESMCFDTLSHALKSTSGIQKHLAKAVCDSVEISLPVRVNWGGGWTDTPPYCNENGGVVLNAAILINGKRPVCVVVKKIDRMCVEFESEDIGVKGSTEDIEDIRDCNNPYDYFALHKAALVASGVIPAYGDDTLADVLEGLGCGLYISTKVIGIPKGSGLGTSSILAGAAIKALWQFIGREYTENELYDTVLIMEQLMSTGGGWQDQVGGLSDGIKYITTQAGLKQNIMVEHLDITDSMKVELEERFAIIYTGQRRLARNLLREVVGNYINGKKETLYALSEMKRVALQMKDSLLEGSMERFICELNHHWELSKMLDHGVTNTCIEQIFATCEELIDAKFIAGAGGGGFLQVILKEGVTRKQLDEHLQNVFRGTGVAVWDCQFVW